MHGIVRFEFKLTENVREIMDSLNNEANLAIAQSLRHAIRPARDKLKLRASVSLRKSLQSTGATVRAVTSKAGRSKKNKNIFYAYAGIQRRAVEVHYLNQLVAQKGKIKRRYSGRSNLKGMALKAEKTTRKWNSRAKTWTVKTKEVKSQLRSTSTYTANRETGIVKRRPNNYWHIIDRGFMHHSGRAVEGYNFVQKAYIDAAPLLDFRRHLQIALTQSTIRLIQRKIRNANK